MTHIKTKMSLSNLITRYPLTYPGVIDGVPSYVDAAMLNTCHNGNYMSMPYGVNEYICCGEGNTYHTFTDEMGEVYSGHPIPYCVLERWYLEFRQYYKYIHYNECGTPYSSATDYYVSVYGMDGPEYSAYEEMDQNHRNHGGDKFYKWLVSNYFISLDLMNVYEEAKSAGVSISMSLGQWYEAIGHIHTDMMYYPDAWDFYGRMALLHEKYGNVTSAKQASDCCEYVDYTNLGGNDMYMVMKWWIEREIPIMAKINTDVQFVLSEYERLKGIIDRTEEEEARMHMMDIEPCMANNISLQRKVADFGNFVTFCKEFEPGHTYNDGTICMHEGKSYIHTGGTSRPGYKTDSIGNCVFDPDAWDDYTIYYLSGNTDEANVFSTGYNLTGRTVSSLDSFMRTEDTVDCLGNSLPGYYRAESEAKFVQPSVGKCLDLKYEIGKTVISQKMGDNMYYGDVLVSAKVFYCDLDGNVITSTITQVNEGDDISQKVMEAQSGLTLSDNITRIDFTYYKGTVFGYDTNGKAVLIATDNADGYKYGVKCVDHCTLENKPCLYYLSESESYLLRYYEVMMDVENKYSDEYETYVDVAMCDFMLTPAIYSTNDAVMVPVMRKEELLGFSEPESVTDNIYLNRGYATVLDRHLRLGEVSSMESLQRYGNGIFSLINLEEERN